MIERLTQKRPVIRCLWWCFAILGTYLLLAWLSYSPLDNAWSVASSLNATTLNKAGAVGAWLIDVLRAMSGYAAILPPLALTLVPSYVLITHRAEQIEMRRLWLWCLSFLALFLGTSALATVLLPDTLEMRSGGVIGTLFHDLIVAKFGQIGVLLFAMLLTSVGFYFCSGQVLIQLLGQFYRWLTEPQTSATLTTFPTEATQGGEKNQDIAKSPSEIENVESHITSTSLTEASVPSLELTDVSHFPRPQITRLESKPAQESAEAFSYTWQNEQAETFPTVTLQPAQPSLTIEEQGGEKNQDIANICPTAPAPQLMAGQSSPATVTAQEDTPCPAETVSVNLSPAARSMSDQTETATPSAQPTYPKQYGESLIHPLLQKKKVLEKPTTPLPTLDLLTQMPSQAQKMSDAEIHDTSARIEQELANFGVKANVKGVLVGPVVTRYEIQPAAGVKASKISNLDSDLARALIFKTIRITDVVPGKPYMGIETPNRQRETVWLRDVLASDAFRQSKAILPMALGKSISGEPIVVDMAKMPHLLVAGQTGGGKSVGVNTMILSLLFKMTPEQLRFIMIDPKVVELSIYNDIPHLLTPVVTDMKKAENALRWVVEEMERRYLLVSSLSVRNIEGYNDKIRQAAEMQLPIPNPLWRPGDTMDALPPPLEKMSYIVLIVDEFADLMMSAGKQVEDHIMRIAQKARAVGIHLILATQRPSTDVITGVIKANIPSRIAFTVASQIDSRTILDKGGAETLLGYGDMLYSGSGNPEIIRIHGAFMTDDDVQRVADNWRARGKPHYIDSIVEAAEEESDNSERGQSGDLDPLFDEVLQYMIDSNVTSISKVQRQFSLGFNRAARIIDQLEAQGVLSAPDNRGKREILAR